MMRVAGKFIVIGAGIGLAACTVPPPMPYSPILAIYQPSPPMRTTAPMVWNGTYRTPVPVTTTTDSTPPTNTPAPNWEPLPDGNSVPVDQSCGWWRLCNLWSGS
jgi:hypothetical protein